MYIFCFGKTEQQLKFCAESIQAKLEEIEKEKQQLFEENQKNSQVFQLKQQQKKGLNNFNYRFIKKKWIVIN